MRMGFEIERITVPGDPTSNRLMVMGMGWEISVIPALPNWRMMRMGMNAAWITAQE